MISGLNETGGSGVSPPYCLSAPVYSTKRASLEDSGQYSCVVTSGGLVFTHSVQLLVKSSSLYLGMWTAVNDTLF